MPGLNGLQVAAAARATRVVFVTAYEEYAVAAFTAAAADYLVKPVSDFRLAQCVLKLQQTSTPRADLVALLKRLEQPRPSYLTWLHAGFGNLTRVLSVDEVLYFQAGDKYTDVITGPERHVIRTSLKELKTRLNPDHFTQVHRGIIVNLRAIEKLERDVLGRTQIHLKNHVDIIPVGRAYMSQFRKM
jgi:DNA-binding LytR/AlgR family response regulator